MLLLFASLVVVASGVVLRRFDGGSDIIVRILLRAEFAITSARSHRFCQSYYLNNHQLRS